MSGSSPLPAAERERLAVLHAIEILDTPPEERFDRLTRIAARALDAPIALVSLVDAERQWFKSCLGLPIRETPRTVSFCAHAVTADAPLVVPDATADPRFADNALVTGDPHIRFYAGHPIHAVGGEPLGTLCVLDRAPREVSDEDMRTLADLAHLAETEINSGELSRSITEREALAAAQEGFLRFAAHELRTPLTSILGYAEMLAEGAGGELTKRQEELASVVLRNANRLGDLVEDGLLVLRLETGRLPVEPAPIDLAEVARRSAAGLAGAAAAAGVTIEIGPDHAQALADPRLAARAAAALLRRGLAESPSGSTVRAVAATRDGSATLSVSDAGAGLEPGEVERVTERFYRADARDGRGRNVLSLTIARGIAELHGGRLVVESEAGRGTRTILELPTEAARE